MFGIQNILQVSSEWLNYVLSDIKTSGSDIIYVFLKC